MVAVCHFTCSVSDHVSGRPGARCLAIGAGTAASRPRPAGPRRRALRHRLTAGRAGPQYRTGERLRVVGNHSGVLQTPLLSRRIWYMMPGFPVLVDRRTLLTRGPPTADGPRPRTCGCASIASPWRAASGAAQRIAFATAHDALREADRLSGVVDLPRRQRHRDRQSRRPARRCRSCRAVRMLAHAGDLGDGPMARSTLPPAALRAGGSSRDSRVPRRDRRRAPSSAWIA